MNHFFPSILVRLLYMVVAMLPLVTAIGQHPEKQPPKNPFLNSLPVNQAKDSVVAAGGQHVFDEIKSILPDTGLQAFYRINPYANIDGPVVIRAEQPFFPIEMDRIFYLLVGMLLALGTLRLLFAKYFNDLFRIFFQTNFRQKSIREQLLQNKIASLFLNAFFCLSGGLFLYFVAGYRGWLPQTGIVQNAGLCIALVAGAYVTKFVG